MAYLRRWWCKVLMENLEIEGHGKRFAHFTVEGKRMGDGLLAPIFCVPRNRALVTELPDDIIRKIFVLVVLEDGDPAILNLALTCQKFHSIVCQPLFLEEAHFSWLDSVVEWKSLPPQHRDKYRRPYTISQCRSLLCGGLYKDCGAGYKGNGQRGVLQGFYSTEDYPGYCSWDCFINDGGLD
ncbi:hypothetical protein ACEWY4_001593 [Coilia grayii]|uniref:F-box domain-containing protein n=1 Tax=Coilia grayii TaxID=363190 RepID=A0ABD1KTE8_9TELE